MWVEVRRVEALDKTKGMRIRKSIERGVIKGKKNKYGILCYDTTEYKEYQATAVRGRKLGAIDKKKRKVKKRKRKVRKVRKSKKTVGRPRKYPKPEKVFTPRPQMRIFGNE